MSDRLREKIISVCDTKVASKGLGVRAAEGASAATHDKPVSCGTTSCAQGPTLGLSVAPQDPRFSCVSLRCLLPRRLLGVGLSFYAFFENRNNNPDLLMEAATWWIQTHRLDHFEKAIKIRQLVQAS